MTKIRAALDVPPARRQHLEACLDNLERLTRTRLGDPDQPLLLVSDGNPATTEEVYSHAARLLGTGPVPLGETEEVDLNRLSLLSESKRCSNGRLLEWLGEDLRYPTYREGLASTL